MFGRERREKDLEAEFAFHLERETAEPQASGLSPEAARRKAALALGGEEKWKEAARAERRGARVELWLRELRLAWRGLWRRPGFAAAAILVLALGVGATSAMFSAVYTVLLHPLPFAQSQRLVYVWGSDVRKSTSQSVLSYPDFLDLRDTAGFAGMSAFSLQDMPLTGRGAAQNVRAATVSANLFGVLRAQPLAGRAFLAGEDQPGSLAGADPVVLSYSLAKREFGSVATAIGQALTLSGLPFRVVGVMPAGFQFPLDDHASLWTTMAPQLVASNGPPLAAQRGAQWMEVVARLAPGTTAAAADARLAAVGATLRQRYPEADRNETFHVQGLLAAYAGGSRTALWLLFGAAGCVLLIACVNLAGLLLARQARRREEFALRQALGAGRGALWRQLGCESLLLGLLGAGAGLVLAYLALAALVPLAPGDVVRLQQAQLHGTAVAFTIALGVGAALLFGMAPGLEMAREQRCRGMQIALAQSRSSGAGRRRWWRGLIGAQFALALVVLLGAFLLLASLARLAQAPLGFEGSGVLSASVNLTDARYPSAAAIAGFSARLRSQLRQKPAVAGAAVAAYTPYTHGFHVGFRDARHPPPGPAAGDSFINLISPGYFRLLHIPLLAGRGFTPGDNHAAPQVMIVNQAFVRRYLAGRTAIGTQLTPGIASFPGEPVRREIVGVAAGTRQKSLRLSDPPIAYIPQAQVPIGTFMALVRARPGEEAAAAMAMRQTIHQLDATIPVYDLAPLAAARQTALAPLRFSVWLLAAFAVLALLLAAVGLHGVMAQAVAQRQREIAVRMALGADRGAVAGMVIREGMMMAAAGLGCGLLAAWVLSRGLRSLLDSQLYATRALDPLALTGALAVLLAAAWLACALPARRAASADPARVLRAD